MTITKTSIIGDVLDSYPELASVFLEIGMHCLGCPCSISETVEQACMAHGADLEKLLAKLNANIA